MIKEIVQETSKLVGIKEFVANFIWLCVGLKDMNNQFVEYSYPMIKKLSHTVDCKPKNSIHYARIVFNKEKIGDKIKLFDISKTGRIVSRIYYKTIIQNYTHCLVDCISIPMQGIEYFLAKQNKLKDKFNEQKRIYKEIQEQREVEKIETQKRIELSNSNNTKIQNIYNKASIYQEIKLETQIENTRISNSLSKKLRQQQQSEKTVEDIEKRKQYFKSLANVRWHSTTTKPIPIDN